jgi:hypothetical protein
VARLDGHEPDRVVGERRFGRLQGHAANVAESGATPNGVGHPAQPLGEISG